MSLITQRISHFLNGVSQRPAVQRHPTQLAALSNGFSTLIRGLSKRPPFEFLGELSASTTGWDSAFVHSITRDDDDRFRVIIANGILKVFDVQTGNELTVDDRSGADGYLTDTAGFRAVTVGDRTIVVNRGITVLKGSEKSAAKDHEALVSITQVDFSTLFTITLAGRTIEYETVDQSDAKSRGQITTEKVAQKLFDKLEAALTLGWEFEFTLLGSTIHIRRHSFTGNFTNFTISIADGLSDQGMSLAKGEVQFSDDLSLFRAPHGTKLLVVGDPQDNIDDYWVEYDSTGATEDESGFIGVWRETVGPGVGLNFDRATMPHQLTLGGSRIEDQQTISRPPAQPTLGEVDTTVVDKGFDEDELAGSLTEANDKIVYSINTGFQTEIDGADGGAREVTITYDIDTSLVEYGMGVVIVFTQVIALGGTAILGKAYYKPGISLENEQRTFTTTWASGDKIRATLVYLKGSSDPDIDRLASLTVIGFGDSDLDEQRNNPIRIRKRGGITLTYPSAVGGYPEGLRVEVVLDTSQTFTHTVTSGGETPTQVATAIAALITAHGTYTASSSGAVVTAFITATPTTDPVVSDTSSLMPDTIAYVRELSMSSNEFSGETVRNITDGSSGSIDSNTGNTITATLTGGVDNKFSPGDSIVVEGTGTYFIWEQATWDDRGAGDAETNPYPSFVDRKLVEPFFFRNRLGFLSGENVILSRSGDLFNFFRTSVIDLQVDDLIDIKSALSDVTIFHSATPWDDRLILWSENAQIIMTGEPLLTPTTVRLELASRYFNNAAVRPVAAGRRLFFAHQQAGSSRIFQYLPPAFDDSTEAEAREITSEVPTYLTGEPVAMAVDAALGFLAVVTDGGSQNKIYVFTWADQIFAGWSEWTFPTTTKLLSADVIDGKLGVVTKEPLGINLIEADLDLSITPADTEQVFYLDKRIQGDDAAVTHGFAGGVNTWTLPYDTNTDQATDGELVVVRRDTNVLLTVTRPAANQVVFTGVDLSAVEVWIGVLFEFRASLTKFYRRVDESGTPDVRGTLKLRYLDLYYADSTEFQVEVTPLGRSAYTKTLTQQAPADGTMRVPVMTDGHTVSIDIVQNTAGGVRLASAEWEGFSNNRARRV